MTGKEAIEWLIPPTNCSNGDENDPIRKHWIAYNMAIKALEQEPITKNDLKVDCISRDEVCRYVAEFVNHEFSTREEEELIDNIITGIEHMPLVTPQEPRWIPVSERLPEEDDYRPCTNHQWNDGAVLYCTDKGVVGIGWYYHSTKNWANLDDRWIEKDGEVVAWMPLPEPYKVESEDKE